MDPRIIASRKAEALQRIETGLDTLSDMIGMDVAAARELLPTPAARHDPSLLEMTRLEMTAGLLERLVEAVWMREADQELRQSASRPARKVRQVQAKKGLSV